VKLSIPFNQRVFRDFRLFVVSVLIENRQTLVYMPMIVDTAASYIAVRPDVFNQLGIALFTRSLVTASERTEAPIGQVDKVTSGARCIATKVQVISISLPPALPAEGPLGASFLQNVLVCLDYDKGTLELTTR
jgi:predicted aspartyl protease